tara:strand:- start:766 stop:1149 length:384 start_codon:yes stop_codon:yes gene_type:complete
MKKLFLPFIIVLFISCSSDSDSNNDQNANIYEESLSGSWNTSFIDNEDPAATTDQNLLLNLDGTGSVSNVWNDGETWFSDLEWSANSTTISLTTLIDNITDVVDYTLLDNVLTITTDEGQVIIYNRL